MVHELLQLTATLWREAGGSGELRLIGGLAVRLHAGAGARTTMDIDVVALTERARERLLGYLERSGWTVGQAGGWWRALRPGAPRLLVDIAQHPVVAPRTFDTISLRAAPSARQVEDVLVDVAGPDDLAVLKLMAVRDQDLVDLLILADVGVSVEAVVRAAAADDIERGVSAGANQARHALQTGVIRELVVQTLGREPSEREMARLGDLLAALERSGL